MLASPYKPLSVASYFSMQKDTSTSSQDELFSCKTFPDPRLDSTSVHKAESLQKALFSLLSGKPIWLLPSKINS